MNLRNPFKKQYESVKESKKNEAGSKTQDKAIAIFQNKPFSEEYSVIRHIAAALAIVAQMASSLTAFALAAVVFSVWLPYWVAATIGAVAAILFEILKHHLGKIAAKSFFRYEEFIPGAAWLLTIAASVAICYFGAPELAKVVYPAADVEAERVDIDSLEQAYSAKIENAQEDVNSYAEEHRKVNGYFGSTAERMQYDALNAVVIGLKTSKASAIEQAELENTGADTRAEEELAALSEEVAKKRERGTYFIIVGGLIAEAIFFLATLFLFYYYWRAFAEAASKGQVQEKTDIQEEQTNESITTRGGARAPIGFYKRAQQEQPKGPVMEQAGSLRVCEFSSCKTNISNKRKDARFCCDDCRIAYHAEERAKRLAEKAQSRM